MSLFANNIWYSIRIQHFNPFLQLKVCVLHVPNLGLTLDFQVITFEHSVGQGYEFVFNHSEDHKLQSC